MKSMAKMMLFCAGATLGLMSSMGAILAAPTPIKFMALGDSITYGYDSNPNEADHSLTGGSFTGGYRLPFQNDLSAGGYSYQFVGSQTSNSVGMAQPNHEGYGSYTIDDTINGGVPDSTGVSALPLSTRLQTYKPDVITLLIGTNDIGTGRSTQQVSADMETLISDIYTNDPGVTLIVGNITPRADGYNSAVQSFNAFLPAIVTAENTNPGYKVYLADLYDAVPLTDLYDAVHPDDDGYNRIANQWYATFKQTPIGAQAVPEASQMVAFSVLLAGLSGLVLLARRRHAK